MGFQEPDPFDQFFRSPVELRYSHLGSEASEFWTEAALKPNDIHRGFILVVPNLIGDRDLPEKATDPKGRKREFIFRRANLT